MSNLDMRSATATLCAILFLFPSWASAQLFECQVGSGGSLELYGSNNVSRTMTCGVTCRYWKTDRLSEYQSCMVQMSPNMPRQKLCSWNNVDNVAEVIDEVGYGCR